MKTSSGLTTSRKDLLSELILEKNIDEENLACNAITFTTKDCKYGKDVTINKLYHYSDITSRVLKPRSKAKLDQMPELVQLKHLSEPISYSKVRKSKPLEDLSYSEEIAGSVKTVYSSSDTDERIDDFMSEAAMIEKVSLFLSEASIHTPVSKDMLKSSMHQHDQSFRESNLNSFHSSFHKKCKPAEAESEVKLLGKKKTFNRSVSARHKFESSFAKACNVK